MLSNRSFDLFLSLYSNLYYHVDKFNLVVYDETYLMIVLNSISKLFGQIEAVKKVSFSVTSGEIVGLLGPNGAGKTTTMRLIVGVLKPTSGSVIVHNMDPINDRMKLLNKIGYLAENNPLYPDLTVKEYISIIMDIKKQHTDSLSLDSIGISDVMHKRIGTLSRGYRQRVGLAAALIGNPEILILDEPTSGLDPIEQEKILSIIVNLKKGRTILLSTHILSEVEKVATRLLIMNRGEIGYDGKKPSKKGSVETLFKKIVSHEKQYESFN